MYLYIGQQFLFRSDIWGEKVMWSSSAHSVNIFTWLPEEAPLNPLSLTQGKLCYAHGIEALELPPSPKDFNCFRWLKHLHHLLLFMSYFVEPIGQSLPELIFYPTLPLTERIWGSPRVMPMTSNHLCSSHGKWILYYSCWMNLTYMYVNGYTCVFTLDLDAHTIELQMKQDVSMILARFG